MKHSDDSLILVHISFNQSNYCVQQTTDTACVSAQLQEEDEEGFKGHPMYITMQTWHALMYFTVQYTPSAATSLKWHHE